MVLLVDVRHMSHKFYVRTLADSGLPESLQERPGEATLPIRFIRFFIASAGREKHVRVRLLTQEVQRNLLGT